MKNPQFSQHFSSNECHKFLNECFMIRIMKVYEQNLKIYDISGLFYDI